MDNNGVVTLSYSWLVQKTDISQREEHDLSPEIVFYTNKTLHRHWHMGQASAAGYHILMGKIFDPLLSDDLCSYK